jgi:hypothetical protein
MTISTTIIKNSYSGDGSTTSFTYAFKIADQDFIEVIVKTNATGVESVRSIGTGSTNYSVTGVGEAAGGSVVFVTAPASTETVILRRSTTKTQALDLIENDNLPANSLENAFDKNLSIIQELQEEIDRSIKISRANTMTSTEFIVTAANRANKILAFDSSGELSVTQELGSVKGNWAASTSYVPRDIVKDTSTNNIFIALTAHTSSGSQPLTTNTDSAKWSLLVDAASATTSATNAASSATAAASSATASASSASTSSTQASNASSSATAAASSATAAASSATSAANSADAFDDIYLGSKSSDPSTDNDGDALAAGMLYFNTTNDLLRVYSGSAWQDAALSSTGVVTLTGTQTLTNKTLTSPKINEDVAVTSTATELNLLDGATVVIPGKVGGTNFADSLLIGHATHGTLSTAIRNTGVGLGALDALTSGDKNTGLGRNAGSAINTGSRNTLIGQATGQALTTASENTIVGDSAMTTNTSSGDYNSGLGVGTLAAVDSGDYNLALGWQSGDALTSGKGNVIIGANADVSSNTGDRQLKIAGYDGSTTTTWIDGSSSGVLTFNAANVTQQALTSSSNAVAWDASAKPNAYHLTTENTTFSAPTNNIEGAFICIEINYDGSHTIAFNTIFNFAADTAPTFTSTNGKTDILVFKFNGSVYQEVGRTLNISES